MTPPAEPRPHEHLSQAGTKLVATLSITPDAQAYFNKLRQQHFPVERNYIDAHLTLFHALPHEAWLISETEKFASGQRPFTVVADRIVSLGYGTAFRVTAPELPVIHRQLQGQWSGHLTNQDRQKRNFHITVQNKVTAQTAKDLQAQLANCFEPFSFTATGIQLWRYLGGPWDHLASFLFPG